MAEYKAVDRNSSGTEQKARGLFAYEDDEYYKKWSGPMILGGFLPFIFAVVVIVSGEIVLNTFTGSCGSPLQTFISGAITVSYIYLLVYTWIFLGDLIRFKIPFTERYIVILRPFKSVKSLMFYYVIIWFVSFITVIAGSAFMTGATICSKTAPTLYSYTVFLLVVYWIGFAMMILYLIKLFYGDQIAKTYGDNMREPTVEEVEERMFRKVFVKFDTNKEQKVNRENVPKLLQVLGIYMPDSDLPGMLSELDPEQKGYIPYEVIYKWFREFNRSAEADPNRPASPETRPGSVGGRPQSSSGPEQRKKSKRDEEKD